MHKGVLRNCLEVVEPRANAVKKAWVLWNSRESLQSQRGVQNDTELLSCLAGAEIFSRVRTMVPTTEGGVDCIAHDQHRAKTTAVPRMRRGTGHPVRIGVDVLGISPSSSFWKSTLSPVYFVSG